MSLSTYDAEAKQRRTVVGVVSWACVFLVLTFTFAYAWRLFVGPYTDFYNRRVSDISKARVYLQADTCSDAHTRSRLEGFNDCERAELILQKSATVGAFYDLMNWMAICHNGICTVAGVNVTDSLWTFARVVFFCACCLYIASMFGIVTSAHGRNAGYYQLPMTAMALQGHPGGSFYPQHAYQQGFMQCPPPQPAPQCGDAGKEKAQ